MAKRQTKKTKDQVRAGIDPRREAERIVDAALRSLDADDFDGTWSDHYRTYGDVVEVDESVDQPLVSDDELILLADADSQWLSYPNDAELGLVDKVVTLRRRLRKLWPF
jgi:hypothetical protein